MYLIKFCRTFTAFLILLNINVLIAKESGSTLKGRVISSNGCALAGANIILPSIGRGTITNGKGEFTISNAPVGRQRIIANFVGFESGNKVVDLVLGKTNEVIFSLNPSAIHTEPVVITGNPYANNPLNSPQEITALSGKEKSLLEASSLGKTLESLPGIYNISAGSVAGKPVVRGTPLTQY